MKQGSQSDSAQLRSNEYKTKNIITFHLTLTRLVSLAISGHTFAQGLDEGGD